MDGASDRVSMNHVRALARYRAQREQQARRVMQVDAAARDKARNACDTATEALASAGRDRSLGEQQYYSELARTANVTIEMLFRKHDEITRLTEAVQGAGRLVETAEAALATSEADLQRSAALYRARFHAARKSQFMQEKLADAIRSRAELIEELNTEEQNTIQFSGRPSQRESWSG